jgi:3-oxoacyl-[acyl-carrier-protein] synthase II
MSQLRVVITGVGPVSGLGMGRDEFSGGLREGKSAIADLTLFDPGPYGRACASEVRGFDVDDYVLSQQAYLDRSSELAFAAMHLAIDDSGLDMSSLDRETTGLVLGSAWGSQDTSSLFFSDVIEKGPRFAKPFLFPHTYANTVISLMAMEYELTGFHMHLASGATASAQALVQAYDLVRTGRQRLVFAGGYESLSEVRMAAATSRGQLSGGDGAMEMCAPFDKSRTGTILGEGSGVLVVEELEHAKKRGARIIAEIAGAGMAGNMEGAIRLAEADGDKRTCVIASANGSKERDHIELSGLLAIPGVSEGKIPVTALTPMIGDVEGATGALHVSAALSILQDGYVPAIENLSTPDDDAPDFVMGEGRQTDIERVFVSSMGNSGNSVCLAIDKSGQ